MEMSGTDVATFAAALFSIVNPLIRIGPFLELTNGLDRVERRKFIGLSLTVQLVGYLVAAWFGRELLELLGVTIPALQAAGGVVIVALAFPMVMGGSQEPARLEEAIVERSPTDTPWKATAVVPFGVPLLVGPGQLALIISTTAVFTGTDDALKVSVVCFGAVVLMAITLVLANPIERRLGETGISVITRLFGFVLLAIGFSIFTSGLKELLPGLA